MSSSRSLFASFLLLLASCGVAAAASADSAWGYGMDSLAHDLEIWRKSPFARVDSIGASVQGRPLWMVTVTDEGDSVLPMEGRSGPKRRVMVHARTHPCEVQGSWIAREMIRLLLDSAEVSRELRRDFIFHIVPVYNPDGVELGRERTNVNGVDLESSWDRSVLEPETQALRALFVGKMNDPLPVELALNLHSDRYNSARFFFFHLEAGTSWIFVELEKEFIGTVQSVYPGRIRDWDFISSWGNGTGTRYPEGFWWTRRREGTMALTFEDFNSPDAGGFDSTARALVLGASRYLRERPVAVSAVVRGAVGQLFPERAGVRVRGILPGARWELFDLQGRRLQGGRLPQGESLLPWNGFPTGAGARLLVVLQPGRTPERLLLPLR